MEGGRAGGGAGGGGGGGGEARCCRLHTSSGTVLVRQGGYLLRWADWTNQYHAAQGRAGQVGERESGERKGEKEFRERSQSSLARTNHAALHAAAGRRSRPEMAIDAPHYAISMLGAGCHWRVVGRGSWSSCGEGEGGPLSGLCTAFWHLDRVYLPVGLGTRWPGRIGPFPRVALRGGHVPSQMSRGAPGTYPCHFQLFDGPKLPASLFCLLVWPGTLALYFWYHITYIARCDCDCPGRGLGFCCPPPPFFVLSPRPSTPALATCVHIPWLPRRVRPTSGERGEGKVLEVDGSHLPCLVIPLSCVSMAAGDVNRHGANHLHRQNNNSSTLTRIAVKGCPLQD